MPGDVGRDRLERPADFGRGVGLHVEAVELAGRAEVEDHDHAAVVVILGHGALRLGGHQLGQREPDGPQRADLQKVAPRDAVARVGLSFTGHVEHGSEHSAGWKRWANARQAAVLETNTRSAQDQEAVEVSAVAGGSPSPKEPLGRRAVKPHLPRYRERSSCGAAALAVARRPAQQQDVFILAANAAAASSTDHVGRQQPSVSRTGLVGDHERAAGMLGEEACTSSGASTFRRRCRCRTHSWDGNDGRRATPAVRPRCRRQSAQQRRGLLVPIDVGGHKAEQSQATCAVPAAAMV